MMVPVAPVSPANRGPFLLYTKSASVVSVRDRTRSTDLVFPASPPIRKFFNTLSSLHWGIPGDRSALPSRSAFQFFDNVANVLYAEVYDGPVVNGRLQATMTRHHQWSQPISGTITPGPVIPSGPNFGNPHSFAGRATPPFSPTGSGDIPPATFGPITFSRVASDVSYLVDPTVDLWVGVTTPDTTFPAWGDWTGPTTPTGKYDLRYVWTDSDNVDTTKPRYDLKALRWETNLLYDATNPYSPPYVVRAFNFTINEGTEPDGGPKLAPLLGPSGDEWSGMVAGTLAQQKNLVQQVVYGAGGLAHYEAADDTGWAVVKQVTAESHFRYLYTAHVQSSTKGTYPILAQQAAHCAQIEKVVVESGFGLKVLRNGSVEYEDMPTGILSVSRTETIAGFPSPGRFRIASPVATHTLRGTGVGLTFLTGWATAFDGGSDLSNVMFTVAPRPTSGFVALVDFQPFGGAEEWHLVDQSGLDVTLLAASFQSFVQPPVDIAEFGGLIYLSTLGLGGAGATLKDVGSNWLSLNSGGVVQDFTTLTLPAAISQLFLQETISPAVLALVADTGNLVELVRPDFTADHRADPMSVLDDVVAVFPSYPNIRLAVGV